MVASQTTRAEDHPIVFVSSFYQESVDYTDHHDSPLWQLRQELAALDRDESFRNSLQLTITHRLTWVAEKAEPNLSQKLDEDELAVADRLVEVLKNSELYVCILADRRQGSDDHGSPIKFQGRPTAVSYFEIELYAAAMYGKRPIPFVLEGFDPGPRLQMLLKILSWAFPDWRELRPQRPTDILREIRKLIEHRVSASPKPEPQLRKKLTEALYKDRAGLFAPPGGDMTFLFLDGVSENRPLPEKERVESLISEYRRTPNYQRKLNRLWLAARELMSVSYRPADVQEKPMLKEFLPYWDCVLGDWAAAAAWHGWHGHLYAGTVAPLNSQAVIRAQGFQALGGFQPEVVLPPDGALASAYYSIAGLLGGSYYWQSLRRAGQHVGRAIAARNGPTDNLLAIRGSIRLRMGLWPCAIADFTKMLHLREKAGAPPNKIADALMHLGDAYALCPFWSKGRNLLKEAVKVLEKYPDDPNLPRARRKLASAYRRARKLKDAEDSMRLAELDASRLAAYDRLGR